MCKNLILTIFSLSVAVMAFPQMKETQLAFDNYHRYYKEAREQKDAQKEKAIDAFRTSFVQNPYRYHSLDTKLSAQACLLQLDAQGVFADLKEQEAAFRKDNGFQKPYSSPQAEIGLFLTDAFNRIWKIADAYRKGEITEKQALCNKVLKAILHYGGIEAGRPNNGPRFHASCFAMPTAAVNIYFCYLKQMNRAEAGKGSALLMEASDMLKVIGLQAWTQPLRNDDTDANVVSIPRFRNHVWWVGGNALAYRSLLPVAAMYRSIPMIDLLAEVCQRGISMTSQNTYTDAFWTEGFTADGAGWGHGKQCLIWGYPIDGTSNALKMLNQLKGSPWAKNLNRDNVEALLNFLRGGAWYYYKGYRLPCLDRGSYVYNPTELPIPYAGMLNNIVENWIESFSPEEQSELLLLQQEVKKNRIDMVGHLPGTYTGTRWFFNNDDLIKSVAHYHITINMASLRCDGLESAASMADAYNFYPTDGMTLFQRNGDEYFSIMGGWDVTASPGVTAREGMERLTPVDNWRGYCSKHNYAAGATAGAENAVAGYIFEKMNASEKEGVNDKGNAGALNQVLYGFKAYKSYFILGDYTIALGAGVTNLQPEQEGSIRTTIDQTAWTDEVFTMKRGKKEALAPGGVHSLLPSADGAPVWLMQKGKFAYRVLPEYTREAFVTCETRPTDWVKRNKVNAGKANLPAQARILRLWANHGQRALNDTYGYVVYSGAETPQDELPFLVLRNDTLVQAVCSADKKVLQAVFYPGNDGLQADGISLTASAPCVVMLEDKGTGYLVSVTDACMDAELKTVELMLNNKKMLIHLPQGILCGKPAVRFIPHQEEYAAKQQIHRRSTLNNAFTRFVKDKKGCVAFLGGSITEMNGWRNMIKEDLKQRFPSTEFTFIEAGIGSTGSTPHAFRMEEDVLKKGTPDLLFVEAAVNDDTNGFTPQAQVRGMEGIVRHALRQNPYMDIVMLHFIYDPFIPLLDSGQQPDVIINHERVANHYHITSINLAQEIAHRMREGEFTWEEFGGTHPAWQGHKYYAATIIRLFDEAMTQPKEARTKNVLPERPLDAFCYDRGGFIALSQATSLSGFTLVDDWNPANKNVEMRRGFVDVPMLVADKAGASFKLHFEGRAIGLFCVAGPHAAVLQYSIDGGPFKMLDTYTQWSSNIYLPWVYMLATELDNAPHTLQVKIADGARTECQIRNFVVNQ